jgi:hypothetical protein
VAATGAARRRWHAPRRLCRAASGGGPASERQLREAGPRLRRAGDEDHSPTVTRLPHMPPGSLASPPPLPHRESTGAPRPRPHSPLISLWRDAASCSGALCVERAVCRRSARGGSDMARRSSALPSSTHPPPRRAAREPATLLKAWCPPPSRVSIHARSPPSLRREVGAGPGAGPGSDGGGSAGGPRGRYLGFADGRRV